MLSRKLFKDYGIKTRDEYFDICVESRINGNIQQAKEQCKKIEKRLHTVFLVYVQENYPDNYIFFLRVITGY